MIVRGNGLVALIEVAWDQLKSIKCTSKEKVSTGDINLYCGLVDGVYKFDTYRIDSIHMPNAAEPNAKVNFRSAFINVFNDIEILTNIAKGETISDIFFTPSIYAVGRINECSNDNIADFFVARIGIRSRKGMKIDLLWTNNDATTELRFPLWFGDPDTREGLMVEVNDDSYDVSLRLLPNDVNATVISDIIISTIENIIERRKNQKC